MKADNMISIYNGLRQAPAHYSTPDVTDHVFDVRLSYSSSLPRSSTLDIDIERFEMRSWKSRPTREWTNSDLLNFIYSMADEHREIDVHKLRGEKFQGLVGVDLYQMTREQFIDLDTTYGELIYDLLRLRISEDDTAPPVESTSNFSFNKFNNFDVEDDSSRLPRRQSRQYAQLQPLTPCGWRPSSSSSSSSSQRKHHQGLLLPKPVEECISQDTDDETAMSSRDPAAVMRRWRLHDVDGFNNAAPLQPQQPSLMTSSLSSPVDDDFRSSPPSSHHHHHHHHQLQPLQPTSVSVAAACCQQWTPLDSCSGGTVTAVPSYDDHNGSVCGSMSTYTELTSPSYVGRRNSMPANYSAQIKSRDEQFTNHAATNHPKRPYRRRCSTENGGNTVSRGGRRSRVTSRLSSSDGLMTSSSEISSTSNRRTQPAGKGSHLWEFIRHLLKSSDEHQSGGSSSSSGCSSSSSSHGGDRIIQWEDRAEGVFRIVNSKAVAKLWGEHKDNRKTKMTYEKLSRALRWCRTDGFLDSVPKDGRFPKKLCFRFGRKATNWRD